MAYKTRQLKINLLSAILFLITVPTVALAEEVKVSIQSNNSQSAIDLLTKNGAKILNRFDTEFGLKGFIAETAGPPTVLLSTHDENYVFVGMVMDKDGKNVTSDLLQQFTPSKNLNLVWKELENSKYIEEGEGEPIIYVFYDPTCGHCSRYFKGIRPALTQKRVRWVPVAYATKSAEMVSAILNADEPMSALLDAEDRKAKGKPPASIATTAETRRAISVNNGLMSEVGAYGTPATLYVDTNDKVRLVRGVPGINSLAALVSSK